MVIVKVRLVVLPTAILLDPNDLEIDGGDATAIDALAVLPVPALVELTFPVVLFFTPGDVAVTLTETVHVPAATMVPPEKVNVVSPAFGENVPPQFVLAPGVEATCRPAGRESVKAIPNN